MMARLSGLLLLVACLATVHGATDSVGTQLKKLQGDSVAQIKKAVAICSHKRNKKTSRCKALVLYNAICKAEHGSHVLACQPGIGGHHTGLVLACTAGYYVKHARGNPACHKSAPPPHAKPHTKPHAAPHAAPHPGPTPAPIGSPPPPPAAQRVLIISVDGLHQQDLEFYVGHNPYGTLAALSAAGTTFTNASTSAPSDSFPGVLALHTGGTFKTHGMLYDNTWGRELYAPGDSNCTGPSGYQFSIDESLEFNLNLVDGGVPGAQTLSQQLKAIDITKLPYTKSAMTGICSVVVPHSRVLSNTVFDLVQSQKGGYTAWADKGFEYEILQGKTGAAVNDLYTPEIKAATTGYDTNNPPTIFSYDDLHTQAIIGWINGVNTGGATIPVPSIFGCDYQSVSVSQKVDAGGYTGNATTGLVPTQTLLAAFDFIDSELGKIMRALKTQGLYETTNIFITAKHGQSPRDRSLLRTFKSPNGLGIAGVPKVADPVAFLGQALSPAGSEPAGSTTDDLALIWLNNQSLVSQAVAALQANASQLGIASIFYKGNGIEMFGDPTTNIRVPDIAIDVQPGVIYTGSLTKIAEHGGFNPDDYHVALLASGPAFAPNVTDSAPVQTTQVAWSAVKILGLDATALDASKAGEDPKYTVELPGTLA